MLTIKPIMNDADYEQALQLVEPYFEREAELDAAEAAYVDALITLIEKYESIHYPMPLPDVISAIKFRMEQQGLAAKDLVGIIGSRNRVYEVLNGKRSLSLAMMKNLHQQLGIPAEILLGA